MISSDAPTAWGLGGTHRRFRVICDELTVWKTEDSVVGARLARPARCKDAQTIVLSNAGFDAERSWQWRVREAAARSRGRTCTRRRAWSRRWVTPEWVEQQRALLPAAAFERVIANIWTTGAGDFVTPEQWAACVDERLARRDRAAASHFAGLDLGLTKDRTALAVVHHDDETIILDELDVWEGTRASRCRSR